MDARGTEEGGEGLTSIIPVVDAPALIIAGVFLLGLFFLLEWRASRLEKK